MTKYPDYIREKAMQLRTEKKMTVPQIAKQMKIAKSTINRWVGHIPIERTTAQTKAQRKGTLAMQAKYKKIRDDAYARGFAEAPDLLKNPMFRDFVTLYIAEGTKTQRNYVALANSDASVILLANYWFQEFMSKNKKMEYQVQIHADHDELEIQGYWADLVGAYPDDIKVIRKSNSNKMSKRQFRSEYGVLTVRLSDTELRSRLDGWMDYIKQEWIQFAKKKKS